MVEEFILGGIQGFPRNKFMMQLDYGLVGDMESTDDGHSCFNLLCSCRCRDVSMQCNGNVEHHE